MGEMISVECPTCGLRDDECIGFGFVGKGTALVVCENCHRFVRKRLDAFSDRSTDPPYFCPYCRKEAVEVGGDSQESAPCPKCGSPLEVSHLGMWD
jgi:hypothetical protein